MLTCSILDAPTSKQLKAQNQEPKTAASVFCSLPSPRESLRTVAILLIKLLTKRLTFDTLNFADAERDGSHASAWISLCEIRKDLNGREK